MAALKPDATGPALPEPRAGTRGPIVVRFVAAPLDEASQRSILNHMVQYSPRIDASFAALSDPTRRGILECLGRADASITDLADKFDMTLTGMKKHVRVLEDAGLVATKKVGRVRHCALGPRRLEEETAFIEKYRQMVEQRLDRLGRFLESTKGSDK